MKGSKAERLKAAVEKRHMAGLRYVELDRELVVARKAWASADLEVCAIEAEP